MAVGELGWAAGRHQVIDDDGGEDGQAATASGSMFFSVSRRLQQGVDETAAVPDSVTDT